MLDPETALVADARHRCGGIISLSPPPPPPPPPPLSLPENIATAGVWRYRDDADGLGDGGGQRYRGNGDGRSDGQYIFGRPRGRWTVSSACIISSYYSTKYTLCLSHLLISLPLSVRGSPLIEVLVLVYLEIYRTGS